MPYFDSASAAPLHPVARQALQASLDEGWADPARLYREGRRARLLLDAAREAAAEAVGCRTDELVFTPSGTHAVHAGVAGALAIALHGHPAMAHTPEVRNAEQLLVSRTDAPSLAAWYHQRPTPQQVLDLLTETAQGEPQ